MPGLITARRANIKSSEMSPEMEQRAVDVAAEAFDVCNNEKEVASHIKKEFDKHYNGTWHCIVGRSFGSFVTHERQCFIYFTLEPFDIVLYRIGLN
ncbi:unnamed protein product [Adineta ricciae]|nr:unnamed protein product [Adineta ricciae]